MVKIEKNGKIKVERDGIKVQVTGWVVPILRIAIADKWGKKSYKSSYQVDDDRLWASAEYRTRVAEQFIDRAIGQRK